MNLHTAALAVLAVAPQALGGARLRSGGNPDARDAWLAALRQALPANASWQRTPPQADDDRLFGGLDVAATLASGKPVHHAGVVASCAGGVLLLPMAERCRAERAAAWAAVLDGADVPIAPIAPIALLALDDAVEADDHTLPSALADRLCLDLSFADAPPLVLLAGDLARIQRAQQTPLMSVHVADAHVLALVQASEVLGVPSLRAPLCALRVARAAALLQGRDHTTDDDLALAMQLVLVPRATRMPAPADDQTPPATKDATPPPDQDDQASRDQPQNSDASEQVLEAALASLPPGLLAQLAARAGQAARRSRGDAGLSGARRAAPQRGRPLAARRGVPRGGARLCLISTLRAAAPWQPLRRAQSMQPLRVQLRPDDLHVRRHEAQRASATVFVIDASGSAAMHRLAEAKGAVELLLADCYARRDKVAVIGFRGQTAELLLPPTRSLVRAKRQLAGLPGGGGTPLAAGIAAAQGLAQQVQRGGATPTVVLLTDGRANVARTGAPGRAAAQADAMLAARQFAQAGHAALVIDTSPQPSDSAAALASAMAARYIALPHADAKRLQQAVQSL
jgi:magnesium chelatase subunit D